MLGMRFKVAVGREHTPTLEVNFHSAAFTARRPKFEEQAGQGMLVRSLRRPQTARTQAVPVGATGKAPPAQPAAFQQNCRYREPGGNREFPPAPAARFQPRAAVFPVDRLLDRHLRIRERLRLRFFHDRDAEARTALRALARPPLEAGRTMEMMSIGTQELDLRLFGDCRRRLRQLPTASRHGGADATPEASPVRL